TPKTVGVHFDGKAIVASAGDTFRLQSTTTHDVAYFSDNVTAANSGVIDVRGPLGRDFTMTFSGITPLVFVCAGGALTVDATSTPATAVLDILDVGLPTDGISQISGDGG